jgi:hypothetical protein
MAENSEQDWRIVKGGDNSPTIVTRDPLTIFFFFLLRNRLPYGQVVDLVEASRKMLDNKENMAKLNPILGQLAANFAAAIRGEGP